MADQNRGADAPRQQPSRPQVPLKRSILPGCKVEINALPDALKRRVVQIIMDVSNGTYEGRPLEDHPSVGDLSDCRKVYFDDNDDDKPRYRLVYRLLPNELAAVEVQAVSVGRRAAMDAYVRAAQRLGRFVDDD